MCDNRNNEDDSYIITVKSGVHITKETITATFQSEDTIRDVLEHYFRSVSIVYPNTRYVLKDEHGIVLKDDHELRRALGTTERIRRLELCHVGSETTSPFTYMDWRIIVCICVVFAIVTLCLSLLAYFSSDSKTAVKYGAIFDAGSVHTTVNVYEWKKKSSSVREALYCVNNANVGVSSYAKVRRYFSQSDCFNKSTEFIPKVSHVFLGATAGMRILNDTHPKIAKAIMSNITYALQTGHNRSYTNASILSGIDEGMYGWIAVNYLNGRFESNVSTIGALDWGGGSSQITFEVNENSGHAVRNVALFDKNYSVYVRSDLCYGQVEALHRYLARLIYDEYKRIGIGTSLSITIRSPCHSAFEEWNETARDLFTSPCTRFRDNDGFSVPPENVTFRFVGVSDFDSCRVEIRKAFDYRDCSSTYISSNRCWKPILTPIPFDLRFAAFSTYFYVVNSLRFSRSELLNSTLFLRRIASSLCKRDAYLPDRHSCFQVLFMHDLLTSGYGFEDWNRIDILDKIGDAQVGWSLGYMIRKMDEQTRLRNSVHSALALPMLILLTACSIVFLLLGCFFFYHARQISRSSTTYERFDFVS